MVIHGLAHGLAPGSICMGRFGVDLLTLLEFLLNTGQIFASTMFYVSTAFILPVDLFFFAKASLAIRFCRQERPVLFAWSLWKKPDSCPVATSFTSIACWNSPSHPHTRPQDGSGRRPTVQLAALCAGR